jgi:effector-binding domain-containing protein
MNILKYLAILIVLLFLALTVYIVTQKGDYHVSRSMVLKTPRITIFEYINDYKNWETFNTASKEDDGITFTYPAKTSGIGGSYTWNGSNGKGFMKTTFVKENDSIAQKMILDGNNSTVNWKLKDTVGGTKVTISSKGSIGLFDKITSFFSGGITKVLGNSYEKSLANLDKTLSYEMKTYSIKNNGIVQRAATNYLMQTISCKRKSVTRNIKIMLPRMVYFFKKNNIPMAGKPFVLYNNINYSNDVVTLSVCIPTTQKIAIQPDSDVESGSMEAFTCLKTTLTGDYSHLAETWKKAQTYITDNDYKPNFAGKYVEVYTKTIDDVKNPSKWTTELLIPVFPKTIQVVQPIQTTSQQPTTAVQPAVNEPTIEEIP